MLFQAAKGLERSPELPGGITYVEDLAWSSAGILPAKLSLVAGDRNACRSQLELLYLCSSINKIKYFYDCHCRHLIDTIALDLLSAPVPQIVLIIEFKSKFNFWYQRYYNSIRFWKINDIEKG